MFEQNEPTPRHSTSGRCGLQTSQSQVATSGISWTTLLSSGLRLPLKLFNKNEGGIARAAAEKARADNLAAHTRSQILLDVQKAYNSAEINRQRVEYIEKESIQKAEESRQIVLTAYRLGEIDLIHLLDAERAFRETRKTYNQALYDYRMSLYELGSAIGLEAE